MKFIRDALLWIALAILAVQLTGCGTVAPKPVTPSQPSFRGTDKPDSGLVSMTDQHAALITDVVRVRYNRLIDQYGQKFTPHLKFDDGVTKAYVSGGKQYWYLDAEHLSDYVLMCVWEDSGR